MSNLFQLNISEVNDVSLFVAKCYNIHLDKYANDNNEERSVNNYLPDLSMCCSLINQFFDKTFNIIKKDKNILKTDFQKMKRII